MSTSRSENQVATTSPVPAWPTGRDWPTNPTQTPPTPRRAFDGLVSVHRGVCPVEQGEGDSFVVAFPRASDAVACALALQQAALSPLRLRIGVHTGDVELRDAGNYMGSTINRAARLRDLAHGGQTVLSAATGHLVIDWLPEQAWLKDLGGHTLRDLRRAERVLQLCHPDLHNDFSPLRSRQAGTFCRRPAQLSSFVGRVNELDYVGRAFADSRLITLCGPGGVGKTRLAVEAAGRAGVQFSDGVWYLDLAACPTRSGWHSPRRRCSGCPTH